MLCPIILGADKTTVSVATGSVEYHPLYLSIGNVNATVRRAHQNAVVPIGFLAIPKGVYFRQIFVTSQCVSILNPNLKVIAHTTTTRNFGNSSESSISPQYLQFYSLSDPE